jgi:hypothetical protein
LESQSLPWAPRVVSCVESVRKAPTNGAAMRMSTRFAQVPQEERALLVTGITLVDGNKNHKVPGLPQLLWAHKTRGHPLPLVKKQLFFLLCELWRLLSGRLPHLGFLPEHPTAQLTGNRKRKPVLSL